MKQKRVTKPGLVFMKLQAGAPREIYAGLLWIAQDRGYNPGWVAHKFKEVFGGWPKPKEAIKPQEPTTVLVEWLGIERRRFTARKKRDEVREAARSGAGTEGCLENVGEGSKSAPQSANGANPFPSHSQDCACWDCIVRLQREVIEYGRKALRTAESIERERALSRRDGG